MTDMSYTWNDAAVACENEGAYLASIESAAQNNWIYEYFRTENDVTASIWIGLNDISKDLNFEWIDGSGAPTYTSWYSGDPNNYQGQEHCVAIFANQQGTWVDMACANVLRALCQQNQTFTSSPEGTILFYNIFHF